MSLTATSSVVNVSSSSGVSQNSLGSKNIDYSDVRYTVENNLFGVRVVPRCESSANDNNPAGLDFSALPKIKTKLHTIDGYESADSGYKVLSVKEIPEGRLKLERYGKMAITGSSVLVSAWSFFGLVFNGFKLLGSTIGLADEQSAYDGLSSAFTKTGIAGTLNGIAQESTEWALGNAGMGLFSRFLDNSWGLSAFSLFDGLSSIGMGRVRYRKKQNAFAIQKSIFNSHAMKPLKFLQSIEQSIYSFFDEIRSPKALMRREPYALFKAAGGGLTIASAALGFGGVLKNYVSEKLNNLPYLFYSIFSSLNLFALFRDGQMLTKRADAFDARKTAEDITQKVEMYSKQLAVPFLGLNNILFAAKGLGLGGEGTLLYNAAMGLRSIGAGIAMLGFGSQSLEKFFKPSQFGPHFKEVFNVILNPKTALEKLYSVVRNLESQPKSSEAIKRAEQTAEFIDLLSNDPVCGNCLSKIISSNKFKSLINKSQAGFVALSDRQSYGRMEINRFDHSVGAGGVGKVLFDNMLANSDNAKKFDELKEYESAFKIACLIHDMGHLARSHSLEQALEGHNNDELLMWMLQDPQSEISKIITGSFDEETLKKIRNIIGHKHCLYKLLKDADRIEYQAFSDVVSVKNPRLEFFKGDVDAVAGFAKNVLIRDYKGSLELVYTPAGAIQKFQREHARQIHSLAHDYIVTRVAETQVPFCLGLAANKNIDAHSVLEMSERDVDTAALLGIKNLNGGEYDIHIESQTGIDNYTGYDPTDKNNRILVCKPDGSIVDVLNYIRRDLSEDLVSMLSPKIDSLNGAIKETRIKITVSNDFQVAV